MPGNSPSRTYLSLASLTSNLGVKLRWAVSWIFCSSEKVSSKSLKNGCISCRYGPNAEPKRGKRAMLRDWVVVLKAFVVVVVGLVTREVVVRTRCGSLRKVLVMKLYADCCLMNAPM